MKGARDPCENPSPLLKPASTPRKQQWVGAAPVAEECSGFRSCPGWWWCWTQQQQHCFSACSWQNIACAVLLHTGYCPFPAYDEASEEAAAFLAGLAVLLSSSGLREPLLSGDICILYSFTWSYEYLFFPGLGFVCWSFCCCCCSCLFVCSLFNLKYKLFRHIVQALSPERCKITVQTQRTERE